MRDTRGMDAFGCSECFGDDASVAWIAARATRVHTRVQESHFSVHVARCACGQHFVEVFTERIDWQGGNDDQTWLLLPVTSEERDTLMRTDESAIEGAVIMLGRERRFLVRAYGADGSLDALWRHSGLVIPRHD